METMKKRERWHLHHGIYSDLKRREGKLRQKPCSVNDQKRIIANLSQHNKLIDLCDCKIVIEILANIKEPLN